MDLTDNHPEAKRTGILALQLHAGKPMTVEFKDLGLRHLKGDDAKAAIAAVTQDAVIEKATTEKATTEKPGNKRLQSNASKSPRDSKPNCCIPSLATNKVHGSIFAPTTKVDSWSAINSAACIESLHRQVGRL